LPVKFQVCIVIPCFNEGESLLVDEYTNFIKGHSEVLVCFVNDGSSDKTIELLYSINDRHPKQVEVVNSEINLGKAEAVRKGFLHCNQKFDFSYIAYLDADLAVSLVECINLRKFCKQGIVFSFGSRILRIGSVIERKWYRFLIGRVVATVISQILSLKVYDTQCGCKLFSKELSVQLFDTPYVSKWLFDIEIFFRMMELFGKEEALTKMIEIPITKWIDRGNSKVKFTYFFNLWYDLYKIRKKYKFIVRK
jgi:dolichyl-phosphate beta-glucosyltransferase